MEFVINLGYFDIVELLIKNGADVNLFALHTAANVGMISHAQFLLSKRADINKKDNKYNTSLLDLTYYYYYYCIYYNLILHVYAIAYDEV